MSDKHEAQSLRITGGPAPQTVKVWLDGVEIGRELRALDLHLGVDGPARATFDVVGHGALEVDLQAVVSRQPRREPAWRRLAAALARVTRRRRTVVEVTGLGDAFRHFEKVRGGVIDRAMRDALADAGALAQEQAAGDDLPEPAGAPHPMVGASRKLAAALEDCQRMLSWIKDDSENRWPARRYDQAVIARAILRRHQEAFAIVGAMLATQQAEGDAQAKANWPLTGADFEIEQAKADARRRHALTEAERDSRLTHDRPEPTTGPPTERPA